MLNERFRMLEIQSEEHAKLASTQLTELQVGAPNAKPQRRRRIRARAHALVRFIPTRYSHGMARHGVEAILLEARFD